MNPKLPELIQDARAVGAEAESRFGHLTTEQLNWKPSESEWSVAQCLEHLVVSNAGYFPIAERIARGEHRPSLKERLPLLPRLFGSLVLRAVLPQTKQKLKARPNFQPSRSEIRPDILTKFQAQQQELIDHMNRTKDVDLKTIITSPVNSIVTYSLLDAYKIVVAHEQRHLNQAKRVTERQGFPGSASGARAGSQ
jgi:DinB superfamily